MLQLVTGAVSLNSHHLRECGCVHEEGHLSVLIPSFCGKGNPVHSQFLLFSCLVTSTLCNPMDCSVPGFSAFHHILEFAQIHVHWVSDATKLSHPLLSSSPPAIIFPQRQYIFQLVGSLHQVAKALELQLYSQTAMFEDELRQLHLWVQRI